MDKANWEYKQLNDVCRIEFGTRVVQKVDGGTTYDVYGGGGATFKIDRYNREDCFIISRFAMSAKCTRFVKGKFFLNDSGLSVKAECEGLSQTYVDAFLRASNDKIYAMGKGAAQRNLDMASFKKMLIPVPPLDVQERIVGELDLLNGVIDRQRAQLKELDNLAQATFYEMFGDPIENPKGWEVKKLGDVCDVRDGTHDSPKYVEDGYPLVTSKNIIAGKLSFENVNYISQEDFDNISKRSKVDDGDIIMPMIGTVGNPIIIRKTREFAIKNVALIKFKEQTLVRNIFVQAFMSSSAFDAYMKTKNKGGTQKFIALGDIRKLPICVPPLSLQQEFADKIAAIESQKAAISQSIAETQKLLDYTMDKYFG